MVPIICVLNHERISWVSIEIYYHDYFVFGHIFMFLTSILCSFLRFVYLPGRQTARSLWRVEPWYVVHMLAYALELNTTIGQAGSRTPFGLAHEGSQELVSRSWADLGSAWRPYPKGFRG